MRTNSWWSKVQRILLDYGESVALAAVALLLLPALWSTQWRAYPVQPEQFYEAAEAARNQIAQTDWPASERAKYENSAAAVAELVNERLREPISLALHAPTQDFYHVPGAHEWIVEEPELYPIQELIASSERVLIRQSVAPPAAIALDSDDVEPSQEPEAIPDEFLPRGGSRVQAPVRAPRAAVTRRAAQPFDETAVSPEPVSQGRGFPFVSVRGWFDLHQQVRAFSAAIHKGFAQAERELEIIDFQLERQKQLRGGQWSAWEPVNREVYFDLVRSAAGLEQDVVSADVTDSAITCPLPARITGRWDQQATHPRLERYELTEEEYERELEFLTALSRRARTEMERRQSPLTKRGFADLIEDPQALRRDVFGAMLETASATRSTGVVRFGVVRPQPTPLDQLVQELSQELDPRQVDEELLEWIRERATADRRVLLFRYLDFDVQPGATYRYRVRLELRNPNYRKPLASAGGAAHVVAGATRWTPWSEPTPPIRVEPLTTYFLAGLENVRNRIYPQARFHVYQYDQEAGTTVEAMLPVAFGQNIAGTARAVRPNPVRGYIEEGLYTFQSRDLLVDGLADLAFAAAGHPDLELPRDSRGKAFLPQFVLVAAPDGELSTVDLMTQAPEYAEHQQRMRWQAEQLEYLRAPESIEVAPGRYENLYDEVYGAPAVRAPQERRFNPLQRL